MLHPDAEVMSQMREHRPYFWLERDRETMDIRNLTEKYVVYVYDVASMRMAGRPCGVAHHADSGSRASTSATSRIGTAEFIVNTTMATLLDACGPLGCCVVADPSEGFSRLMCQ
jgi:hypothetical protein